jgi:hypothetical protein
VTSESDNWWYSPAWMLLFADYALMHCAAHDLVPSADMDRAIGEGRAGAFFALGMAKRTGREMWMRLVDPSEGAPYVRVRYLENTGPRGSNVAHVVHVEVVSFTKHSAPSEPLGAFLFRTKLDPSMKAYSADTVIVAHLEAGCEPEEARESNDYLLAHGAAEICFAVGMMDEDRIQIAQIHPEFGGPLIISLDEALASDQLPVAQNKRGMSAVASTSAEPIPTPNPFLEYQ